MVKVLSILKNNPNKNSSLCLLAPTRKNILIAARAINDAQLVAFPTETVYGLGGDATNDKAVAKIFSAKGRPKFNPLIIHLISKSAAREIVHFCPRADKLADAFWPGPLTLVLNRKPACKISLLASAGLSSIAIRVPNNPLALQLLEKAQTPVAAPSANLSGAVSPTNPEHVIASWANKTKMGPSIVLDGGPCRVGLESTVVDLTTKETIILRPGGITKTRIEREIGELKDLKKKNTDIKSPGMLAKHYAPRTPIIMNAKCAQPSGVFIGFGGGHREYQYNLSETANLEEAAANLFSFLHEVDKKYFSSISIAPIPNQGLGVAINDRLSRASKK